MGHETVAEGECLLVEAGDDALAVAAFVFVCARLLEGDAVLEHGVDGAGDLVCCGDDGLFDADVCSQAAKEGAKGTGGLRVTD